MRTSEFKRVVEELGFKIEIDSDDEIYINNGNGTYASVPKNKRYNIDTDWDDFDRLEESEQSELFFILAEYASTPISEREEEKRYRLRSLYFFDTYLLIEGGVRYPSENEDYKGSEHRKVIFTESELKTMDLTGFEKVEVLE